MMWSIARDLTVLCLAINEKTGTIVRYVELSSEIAVVADL
jgi:hypothetical protein